MTGYNPPLLFPRAIDHDGSPAPGAKLYHYVSNTSIYKPIYYDVALTSECPQPLVADSEGRFAQFFLEAGAYKFVLFDANDVQLRPPEDPIYGQGGVPFGASDLATIIGNSSEIVWNLNEDETQLIGSLVWPLTPPIGGYINAPASIYKNESGGLGHGTDTFTAKNSAGSDSRLGIEFAYSGSATTATVGDLDGTRIDFGSNVGGAGIHARGVGLHSFDGLISGELADSGAAAIRPATIGVSGRIGTATPADFRAAIGTPGGAGAAGQVARWSAPDTQTGDAGLVTTQAGGKTNTVILGEGVSGVETGHRVRGDGAYPIFYELAIGVNKRWRFAMGDGSSDGTISAFNDSGAYIDSPWECVNAAGGEIALGGSTGRPVRHRGAVRDSLGAQVLSSHGAYTGPSMQATNLAGGGAGLSLPVARDNSGNVVPRSTAQFRGDIGTSYLYDYTQKYNSADQGGGTTEFTLRNITIPASALAGTSGVKVEIIAYMATDAMDAYLRFYVGGINIISASASRATNGYVKVILTMCANNARTGIQSIAEYYNVAAGLFYMNDPSDATVSLASDISASIRGYTMSPTGNIWLKSVRITSA